MADHVLVVVQETDEIVQFSCSVCNTAINFVKEGLGEPNPIQTGDTWSPPPNYMEYLGQCPGQ